MEDKIKAVRKIQNYISNKIKEPITLSDVSKVANYSLWYTSRIFKELTGKTIFEYIRSVRLTNAAKTLRDTDKLVIDVAFDFVFDSHEGFTRAFSKEFNITPKTYQKSPVPLQYFIPYQVMDKSLRKEKKEIMEIKSVFVQVVERPKRKAIIKRGVKATHYFEYCEEVNCDIWGVLSSVKEAISEPVGMWLSKKLQKPNTSLYVQGVEVNDDYKGKIPEGCEIIDLPETKMMIFQGEPYDDENFETEVSQVMNYVSKYNPKVHGYDYDKNGYRFQYEPLGYRGYIEGRTVIKL
ncbi:helix-turn-helix domain-containing protein [Mycoplasmatota bacterium WC30]